MCVAAGRLSWCAGMQHAWQCLQNMHSSKHGAQAPQHMQSAHAVTLTEASISRQPASTAGWLATMPTVRPLRRVKPESRGRGRGGEVDAPLCREPGVGPGPSRYTSCWGAAGKQCVPSLHTVGAECTGAECTGAGRRTRDDVLGVVLRNLKHLAIVHHLLHHAQHVVGLHQGQRCGYRLCMGDRLSTDKGVSTCSPAAVLAKPAILSKAQ